MESSDFANNDALRSPYKRPMLTVFGGMVELTATGTKNGNENQGNTQGKD